MNTVTCWTVRMGLPSWEPEDELPQPVGEHVAGCLRCQAEVARVRSLHRRLAGVAGPLDQAPADLVGAVSGRLPAARGAAIDDSHWQRTALVAAGAVVAAAGTMAVIGWRKARSAA